QPCAPTVSAGAYRVAAYVLPGLTFARANLFVQAEDGIRVFHVTGVQTCALPIYQLHLHRLLGRLLEGDGDVVDGRTQLRRRCGRSEERRVGKECRSRWSRCR